MSSTKLQSCIHDYAQYLEYLLINDVLECDGQFIVGEKSKGYKYTEQHRDSKLVDIYLKDQNLLRSVYKRARINELEKRKHPYLAKWFNQHLTIDLPGANKAVEFQFHKAWDSHREKLMEMYDAQRMMLEIFDEKRFYFSIDEFAGRVHTNLSSLPKYLRSFVKYNGQTLVSFDIKNCQPYLLNRVLDPDFFKSIGRTNGDSLLYINLVDPHMLERRFRREIIRKERKKIKQQKKLTNKENNHQNKFHTKKWINQHIRVLYQMISRLIEKIPASELQYFREITLSGNFYESMMERMEMENDGAFSRDDVKEMMFKVLFSDNRWFGAWKARYKRYFAEIFPNIYNVLKAIKSIYKPHLACILQTLEAQIILNRVVRVIEKTGNDIPIWTIHDNIVTTTRWGDYVKQVMSSKFEKAIGYAPVISVEFWIPENKNAIRLQENADETLKLNSI